MMSSVNESNFCRVLKLTLTAKQYQKIPTPQSIIINTINVDHPTHKTLLLLQIHLRSVQEFGIWISLMYLGSTRAETTADRMSLTISTN